jgi:hypothetical protein
MTFTIVTDSEDGHAQERRLLGAVLERVGAGEAWIAERNFLPAGFFIGLGRARGVLCDPPT